jgi:predicted MPP superfamily phosphohydrolase
MDRSAVLLFLLVSLIELVLVILLGAKRKADEDKANSTYLVVTLRELPGALFGYWFPLVLASAALFFVVPFFSGASITIAFSVVVVLLLGRMLRRTWARRYPERRLALYWVQMLTVIAYSYFCFGAIMFGGLVELHRLPKAQKKDYRQLISSQSPANCDFAALSDLHINMAKELAASEKNPQALTNLKSLLAELPCKPKLLFVSGDLVDHGNPRAWEVLTTFFKQSTAGMTVLAAPGNHDVHGHYGSGTQASKTMSYLRFSATLVPGIETHAGRKLTEELEAEQRLTMSDVEVKEQQDQADLDWSTFAPRDRHGNPIGTPPVLTHEKILQDKWEQLWKSMAQSVFPLLWVDQESQTAVIILNSSSEDRQAGSAFGEIDDDQFRALASLFVKRLPPELKTIFVLTHHPATRRGEELIGSAPDLWWFPWAWRGTEIYVSATLNNQPTNGQKLMVILEKAVEQRPQTQFALVAGHRHSLWIGDYGRIQIIQPPSLAREYGDSSRAFPAANRIIAGWYGPGRLTIRLIPRAGVAMRE